MRQQYDPQSLSILASVAVRLGQSMGLHREKFLQEHSIFEAEIRRRLWWQIVILDYRSTELAGTSVEVDAGDIKRPLNVNDSDLIPMMTDPPVEHEGITEMLFCSIRYEMDVYFHQLKAWKADPFVGGPHRATSGTISEKDKAINELESRLEQRYLKYCDPSVPFHLLASGMSRSAICQMRLTAHQFSQYLDKGASLPQTEKDMLFSLSLQMVKDDNLAHSTKSIQRYLWHINIFLQLDAFIFLLRELCDRVDGDLVEQAWQQVAEVYHHHPEMIADVKNTVYATIGNLAIKAWERRAEEMMRSGRAYQMAAPGFIETLLAQRRDTMAM